MESILGFADLKVFITKTTLPSESESKHRPFVQKGSDWVSVKLYVHSWERLQIWPEACVHLPDASDGKESACKAGDPGWIPESGRSPGGGKGNTLQSSFLGNPMDRGAWQALSTGSQKNQT